MKTLFITMLLFTLAFINCNKNNRILDQAKDDKGKTFYLNHEMSNIDYEIFLNDILVGQSFNNNGLPSPINLNAYIFENGLQKVKIKLTSAPGKKITQEVISRINKNLAIHLLTGHDYNGIKEVVKLDFPAILSPVQQYEHEWSFQADAIKGIDHLKDSQNLVQINKELLQKEVLQKFEELRKLLNEGNGQAFMKEIETAKENFFLAENMSTDKQNEYNADMKEYFDSHKGTLPALGNSTMRIMGNGRAVALENNSNHKGLGILSSEDVENNTFNMNYIILHKPIGSDQFNIFRYNCNYTNLK
ncbi:hypothetical protein [Chryseobacterium sp. Mn2064]|uniref:hypothetical protein n=1 Tax=Chryseobacterium sp. Mn2064 TaxID=3395263 RepID=UPI003BD2FC4E